MDKNAIKRYAVWARRELISRVSQRAAIYGITDEGYEDPNAQSINGKILTSTEIKQRQALITEIRAKGYEQVMEEVAYTWFNRFIALRFMEVNGYLPSHVRVFTDDENNFKPQILTEAINLEFEGLDMDKVFELKNGNDNDELFKYLIIVQCNDLNAVLPNMFQKIEDYTELLFPDNILRDGSVVEQMITEIPEEDWQDAVQIIGWMYQYYNAELKDDTFAKLKKNVKITKERIPAATQLFTPDWIVRYMVENSLGRLWYEGHKTFDKSQWKYYLDEAEQEPGVEAQLAEIRKEYESIRPEDIKVIDPCMGSGHILVYAFDVLMQIYTSAGWSERDAAKSIVENNIYGLDIDDRAGQLSYFAIMMKARQYNRRIFSAGVNPMVYAIQDSSFMTQDLINYVANGDSEIAKSLNYIKTVFKDAKDLGSIINVKPIDFASLYMRMEVIRADNIEDLFSMIYQQEAIDKLLPLIKQAEVMAQKYDVVVTNPPYMGASGMNAKLSEFIKDNYSDYKNDFFSVFVKHASEMTKKDGYCGFLTPYVWMFIQSYEKMRNYLYKNTTIETLIQFEYSAFEEATVPICTFVFKNRHIHKKGCYLRLTDFRGGMEVQREKTLEAIENHKCGFYFEQSTDNFSKIPGSPVAYWVSENFTKAFEDTMAGKSYPRMGLTTGQNDKYLRLWVEVNISNIGFGCTRRTAKESKRKWFPYNKGGLYRKWYGNQDYIVNWYDDGYELQNTMHPDGNRIWAHNFNLEWNFKEHICWNDITSGNISFRLFPEGFLFDSSAAVSFVPNENKHYLLGFFNTKFVNEISKLLNPTLHFKLGDYENLPYRIESRNSVEDIVKKNIDLSKADWDSFETSWDFKKHPLI